MQTLHTRVGQLSLKRDRNFLMKNFSSSSTPGDIHRRNEYIYHNKKVILKCSGMSPEALFVSDQHQELPRCTLRGEWIKRLGHRCTSGCSTEVEGRGYSCDMHEGHQQEKQTPKSTH